MPKNRIIPAIAIALAIPIWAWAQGTPTKAPSSGPAAPAPAAAAPAPAAPAPAPVEPPTEAEKFLDGAIKRIAALKSVMANLVEKVDMLGQQFSIKGRYLRAPKDRVYLEINVVGLPDSKGVMLQVCDGVTFWDYQQVFETQIYHKSEAGPILQKLRASDLDDETRDQILNQMGFAGPEVLLVGLRKTIKFDQKDETTLDGRPVWKITGNWKNRDGLLGPNSQPLPLAAVLPSYIPSLVSVYIGKDDSWPYKVVLVGQQRSMLLEDTRPIGPDGRRIGPRTSIQKPLKTRIELEYTDVKFDVPIPEKEFAFQAPQGAQVEDETKRILNMLEEAITMRSAQKRSEAAKGDEPLLNQSIEIPREPGEKPASPPASIPPG